MPSSIRWTGGARAVAQLRTYTFTGVWTVGDVITVTYGNYAFSYTITGSATIATFLPLLVAAYNALSASDYPAHAEQTAGGASPAFTLTADTAGKPFAATISTNSAAGLINGGATTAGTATVASAGPNDVGTPANYSTGLLPANGDTLNIDPDAKYDLLYSLDALAAVTTLTLNVLGAVKVGLPTVNGDSGTRYAEYRPQFLLTAGATAVNVGAITASQSALGTPRFKHDGQAGQTTWTVRQSGFGQDDGLEAVLLRGTHAANALAVTGNSQVGVAVFGGGLATLLTLSATGQGAYVRCGAGTTLGTVTNDGGTIEVNSAIGAALNHTANGGITTVNGAGNVAQITALGGTVVYNAASTLNGATVLMNGALLDAAQGVGAIVCTNPIDCFSGADVNDPGKRINGGGSLVVDYNGGGPLPGYGANYRLTRSATA